MPTILVIEDELFVRKNICDLLNIEGFQALGAENGHKGVHLAHELLPDLIICDIQMPQLDGFDVLKTLQEQPITANIPFIFLTARTEREDFRKGMTLGADDYLTKPFTRAELLEAIATRLAKHQMLQQVKQNLTALQHQTIAEKDDFINLIAHELRTPLLNIQLMLEILQTTPHQQEQKTYLELLQTECSREIKLLSDLLEVQRLSGKVDPESLTVIDLQEWIPAIARPFQPRAQKYHQALEVHIDPAVPTIRTDWFALERVITELLNNACKYTIPHGKICIAVNHLTSAIGSPGIQLAIGNNAEIPAPALSKLFEKFYRVPNPAHSQQVSTGLGLALVQKLVQQLNGKIAVTSEAGWTQFMIQLPLDCEHPNFL